MDTATLVNKMIRAAGLDVSLYEEVERDTGATSQALTVVIIVAIASGIGGFLGSITGGIGSALLGFVGSLVWAIVAWVIWLFLTYWIGTNLFGGTASLGELLRTIGFASSPFVLVIFRFIPCVGPLIALAGAIWALVAGVVAVRQALDFTTEKAIFTVLIGWAVVFVVTLVYIFIRIGAGAILGSF